jgi:hypothetical protein
MKVTQLKTTCFDQWQVIFSAIQQTGSTFYKFSISDCKTGSQYDYPDIYLTETKAYLSAYFLCLRASLDREQQPALLIELTTGYVLSSNLPAFELLAIDATGANVLDFIVEPKDYQQIEQQLLQTGEAHQLTLLHNADGLPMECEIKVQMPPYCSRWAIFYFKSNQSELCSLRLNH